MNGNIYLDASFFIATQIIDHPFHSPSTAALSKMTKANIYISVLTLDEILHALSRYISDRSKICSILDEKIFQISRTRMIGLSDTRESLIYYTNYWKNSSLKPRDALHIVLMKEHNIRSIATYDSDFIDNQKKLKIYVIN